MLLAIHLGCYCYASAYVPQLLNRQRFLIQLRPKTSLHGNPQRIPSIRKQKVMQNNKEFGIQKIYRKTLLDIPAIGFLKIQRVLFF